MASSDPGPWDYLRGTRGHSWSGRSGVLLGSPGGLHGGGVTAGPWMGWPLCRRRRWGMVFPSRLASVGPGFAQGLGRGSQVRGSQGPRGQQRRFKNIFKNCGEIYITGNDHVTISMGADDVQSPQAAVGLSSSLMAAARCPLPMVVLKGWVAQVWGLALCVGRVGARGARGLGCPCQCPGTKEENE